MMKKREVYIRGNHPMRQYIQNQYIDKGFIVYDCLDDCSAFIANKKNAEMVILTSPDASDNLQEDYKAIHFLTCLAEEMPADEERRPIVHVILQSSVTFELLLKRDLPLSINEKLNVYPFTVEDMWAKKVLVNLPGITEPFCPPLDRCPIASDSTGRIHVVISGFDKQAEAFAIHTALIAHFPNYRNDDKIPIRTRITVIDENVKTKRNILVAKYQSLFEHSFYRTITLSDQKCELHKPVYYGKRKDFVDVEWEFVEGDITHRVVREKLAAWSIDRNRLLTIVISCENEEINLAKSLSLPHMVHEQEIPVFVRMSHSVLAETFFTSSGANHIYPFGMCDYGYDVKMPLVEMAKLLKYFYDCSYGDKGIPTEFLKGEVDKAWNMEHSMKMRLSNIYNVMTIPTKMHSVGHDRSDADTFYALNRDEIKLLAEVEHNRWNVERLILGDRPCTDEEKKMIRQNIREIFEARRAGKKIPVDLKKKYKKDNHVHYDLCAYDELEIDPTGKNVQTYDYDLTASIPLIYKTYYGEVANEDGTI